MKKSITILLVLALAVAAWYAVTRDSSSPAGSEAPSGSGSQGDEALGPAASTEIEGTVTAIDLEQAMVDGPYVVTVKDAEGAEYDVAVPSMGILLCAAKDSIMDPTQLEVGDRVEASGTLTAEGAIVPCESAGHYLRRAE